MKRLILLFMYSILVIPLRAENIATQEGITVSVTEYLPDDVVAHKAFKNITLLGKYFTAKGMKPLRILIENTTPKRLMIDTRSIVARGQIQGTEIVRKLFCNSWLPLLYGSLIIGADFFWGFMPAHRAVQGGYASTDQRAMPGIHAAIMFATVSATLHFWAVSFDYNNHVASAISPFLPSMGIITIAPGLTQDIVAVCDEKQFDGKLTLRIFDAKDMYYVTHLGGQGVEDGIVMKCNLTL